MASPEQHNDHKDPQPGMPLGWARYYVLVLEFLAYLAVLGYLGYKLDERYGWKPWGLLGGLLTGLAVGLYRMIREGLKVE